MPSTRDIDFNSLKQDVEIAWPKRGKKKQPLPEPLVAALHKSWETSTNAMMIIPMHQKTTFFNLLARAGKELNYRIEKIVQDDTPEEGMVTYYFKVVSRRHSVEPE